MSWDPTQRPQPDGGQGQSQGQDPYSGYGSPQNPYGAPQPNPSDPNTPPQNPYGTPPPGYNPPPQSPYGNQGYPGGYQQGGGYQQAKPFGSSSFSLDVLKDKKNLGYVIAGGAAIIGLIAFFLPYLTGSISFIVTESTSISGASIGWLWLEEIGALIVAVISAVLVFRNNAFGLTNMPVEKQIRISRITLIGAAILALVIHLIAFASLEATAASASYLGGAVSVGLGFGFWLFLLAAIAMVVGAVIVLRAAGFIAGLSQPYGQYPSQSSQYPPYQPPQQYPPYQQPSPPPDQQQPPQQQNPPQQW